MSARMGKGRSAGPAKGASRSGTKPTNKSTKPVSSKSSSKPVPKKGKGTTKPQQKAKFNFDDDDDDNDQDFEIDGDYDFSSDVEVMDLSSMLDDPSERKVRKGGKNKQLKPVKKSKKSRKLNSDDEQGGEEDEEIDSDLDISTADDFIIKTTVDKDEPTSVSHQDKGKVEQKTTQMDDQSELSASEEDSLEDELFDDEDEFDEDDDEDLEDEDDENDQNGQNAQANKLAKLFGGDSDNSQSGSDNDSDDGANRPSALEEYLSRYEKKGTQVSDGKTKVEKLREIARNTRRKGELFSNEEQIGDESINVGIHNLQDAVGKLGDESSTAFSAASPGPLSVSSLLASLKSSAAPISSGNSATNSMLASLKAPSLRKLEQQAGFVIDKQQSANKVKIGDVARGRLERKELYTDKSIDISKFQGIVQHNRGLETLDLTKLQKPEKHNVATTGSLMDQFTVTNELEQDLDDIIDLVGRDQAQKAKLEKEKQILSLHRNLSLEELQDKAKYMAKMKLSAFFEHQRAARIAKVKSRQQRKYLRAQDEKAKRQKLQDAMDGKVGGMTQEEMEDMELQFEKQRIKERALLQHKNTSRWAKRKLRIAAKDQTSRQLLQDQLALGQQLRIKLGHKENEDGFAYEGHSDNGDESAIGSDDDDDTVMRKQLDKLKSKKNKGDEEEEEGGKKKGSALLNLPFMKRAEEELKRRNDAKLAQLRQDLSMQEDYSSDEEGNVTFKGRAVQVDNQAEQNNILSKESRMKKSYGPSGPVSSLAQSGSGPGVTMSETIDAYANDANQPSVLAAEVGAKIGRGNGGNLGKMGSMFGGVFDLDDNELTNFSSSDAPVSGAPSALSLVAQQQQRENILAKMRQVAGKEEEKTHQDDNQQKHSEPTTHSTKTSKSNPSTSASSMNDSDDDSDDDEEENPWMNGDKGAKKSGPQNDQNDQNDENDENDDSGSDDEENPWLVQPKAAKLVKKKGSQSGSQGVALDLGESLLLADVAQQKNNSNSANSTKTAQTTDSKSSKAQKPKFNQNDLVSLAFTTAADQDDEFEQMKLKEMEAELPQYDSSNGVAGWGSWAGVEKTKAQLRREADKKEKARLEIKAQRDAILASRSDFHLKNVIVNQKKDEKSHKYKMDRVPLQYTNMEEYRSTLRVPLGREWNTAEGFRQLNKPSLIVNTGQVVQAMKWNKSMEGFTKRGDKRPERPPKQTEDGDVEDGHIPKEKKQRGDKQAGPKKPQFQKTNKNGPQGPTIRKTPPGSGTDKKHANKKQKTGDGASRR